jgi:hypothetical protein
MILISLSSVPLLSHLTSCTPTKSNLYLHILSKLSLVNLSYTNFSHSTYQISCPYFLAYVIYSKNPSNSVYQFVTSLFFYGEGLLAPCPTTKLEDHPLSAVCNYLFNINVAVFYSWKLSPQSAMRPTPHPPNMVISSTSIQNSLLIRPKSYVELCHT